jgi:glycogen debranching enzyme
MCPNGLAILQDSVKRRFPADDSWVEWDHPRAFQYESTVADLIQEIVQRHATGIEFREYNVSILLRFVLLHGTCRHIGSK